MKFQWNPLKYGDFLGLVHGPLSGHVPGQLTSQGLDWQGKLNPGVSRTALDSANRIAPWVAAAIATFGGSSLGEVAPAAGEAAPEAGATGAFDMWGSQSSPTDASTVFDQSPHGPTNAGMTPFEKVQQAQRIQGLMGMGGKSQPYQPQTPMYDDNTGQNNNRDALVAALLQGRR